MGQSRKLFEQKYDEYFATVDIVPGEPLEIRVFRNHQLEEQIKTAVIFDLLDSILDRLDKLEKCKPK